MTPLARPGQMRLTILAVPTGVVGEHQLTVTPEGCAGGWKQVLTLLLASVEIAAHQMAEAQTQGQFLPFVLPGNGEQQ